MKRKKTQLLMIALVLGALALIPAVQQVKAEGLNYIYIDPNGNVIGTDKIQRNGDVYTFTADIVGSCIIIQKDGITLDGANKILSGVSTSIGIGISLNGRSNVMVKNVRIQKFKHGVQLDSSTKCRLYHNQIVDGDKINGFGIYLLNSSNNTLFHNKVEKGSISGYRYGVFLDNSSHNKVSTALFRATAPMTTASGYIF